MAEPFGEYTRQALGKVVALARQPQPMAIVDGPGTESQLLPLPQTPGKAAAIMTAHRVHSMPGSLSHAVERMDAARKTRDPELRKYHVVHIRNHLARTMADGHMLADNLRRHYPAEGKELDATCRTLESSVSMAGKSLSPSIRAATTAHLLQTTMNECTHAVRHAALMAKTDPVPEWEFNADHSQKHLHGALEHAVKLMNHVRDNYPAEAKLLVQLDQLRADDKAERHFRGAAPAAWPSGKAYAKSFLSPQRDEPKIISAPGAGTFAYGLKQEPSQTVSPSPPLPPSVPLPSPKELRGFAGELAKMRDDETNHHLQGAMMHLESAAEKMPNNPVSALASLRSAQMAIQDEWRWRIQHHVPRIAYVFSANTPPAEQSSQQQAWAKAQAEVGQMQGAASKIAEFIDRVRRAYFGRMGMENQTAGGGMAGQPNARL